MRKCLYLEWISRRNGRVVIQSTRLAVQRVGARAFDLKKEQCVEQGLTLDKAENFAQLCSFADRVEWQSS